MKVTEYFKHVRRRPGRELIRDEWIEQTAREPEVRVVQSDGRIRLRKRISGAEGAMVAGRAAGRWRNCT